MLFVAPRFGYFVRNSLALEYNSWNVRRFDPSAMGLGQVLVSWGIRLAQEESEGDHLYKTEPLPWTETMDTTYLAAIYSQIISCAPVRDQDLQLTCRNVVHLTTLCSKVNFIQNYSCGICKIVHPIATGSVREQFPKWFLHVKSRGAPAPPFTRSTRKRLRQAGSKITWVGDKDHNYMTSRQATQLPPSYVYSFISPGINNNYPL